MQTTQSIHQPNLTALRISLPMWSNEEITLEIEELKHWISDLQMVGKDASYYENKKSILEQALKTRG